MYQKRPKVYQKRPKVYRKQPKAYRKRPKTTENSCAYDINSQQKLKYQYLSGKILVEPKNINIFASCLGDKYIKHSVTKP